MRLAYYIAKRYLISKKSHNIINVITAVSVTGVTIGALALVVVLSVFNGFEDVVSSLYNSFNPDLKITARKGKVFHADSINADALRRLEGVAHYVEVVEENALIRNKQRQHIATLKGVSDNYQEVGALDTMLVSGSMLTKYKNTDYAVLGYGVSYYLDVDLSTLRNTLTIYVPKANGSSVFMNNAFNAKKIGIAGVFSVQQDIDTKYALMPLHFLQDLLGYTDEVTSIEIYVDEHTNTDVLKTQIQEVLGDSYLVKDRYEQEALLYKIMKSEKLAIYLILTFILIIATFNVVGSISIIMIDKKQDISFLWNMGADKKLIERIFFLEGMLISFFGAVVGLLLGFIICWLQQTYGILQLGASGSFVVQAYPVRMQGNDFLLVFCTVIITGLLATFYPVKQIIKNYFKGNYFVYKE